MKTYEDYLKEYKVLLDMFRCSTRYLSSLNNEAKQKKIDKKLEKDFKDMYHKYSEKLNEECIKETGKPIL